MNLSAKSAFWHLGSALAGAYAMIAFASSHSIDLYAAFDQMKIIYGASIKLAGYIAPVLAIGYAAYRNYGMEKVPKNILVAPETKTP